MHVCGTRCRQRRLTIVRFVQRHERDAIRKAGLFTEILKCSTNTLPPSDLSAVCVHVFCFSFYALLFHFVRSDFKFRRKNWKDLCVDRMRIHYYFPVAFHSLAWIGSDVQDSDRWYFSSCLPSIASLSHLCTVFFLLLKAFGAVDFECNVRDSGMHTAEEEEEEKREKCAFSVYCWFVFIVRLSSKTTPLLCAPWIRASRMQWK